MDYLKLKKYWKLEEKRDFKGWDFSYIDKDRMISEVLPWDYRNLIDKYLNKNSKILDMGTGGGEFLLTLNHPYKNTYATECYLPNYELCKSVFKPLGIDVRLITNDEELPFSDKYFDIIINRHESFSFSEVTRILKTGGIFITQQVGDENNKKLSEFLIPNIKNKNHKSHNLESNINIIQEFNFEILDSGEYFPEVKFLDIGALVYFAKIIEWEFPNFTVDKCFKRLCSLQKELESCGYIKSKNHRFYIVSKKN